MGRISRAAGVDLLLKQFCSRAWGPGLTQGCSLQPAPPHPHPRPLRNLSHHTKSEHSSLRSIRLADGEGDGVDVCWNQPHSEWSSSSQTEPKGKLITFREQEKSELLETPRMSPHQAHIIYSETLEHVQVLHRGNRCDSGRKVRC